MLVFSINILALITLIGKIPPKYYNIVAAFRGMHVSPAKHSYAWLPRKCDYRTDRRTHTQTDAGQSDPYVPLCFAGDTKLIAQVWWKSTQRFSLYGVHKLISIYVHYDLDLWPSKSIGFILSPWLTCLPSLIKKSTTVKSLLCSQAY